MIRALKPAVPPKLYRHFALITVMLTAGLAMFADGENREAIAAQVEHQQEQARPRPEGDAGFARRETETSAENAERGLWYRDESFVSAFGQPMDRKLISHATGVIPIAIAERAALAGYSEDYLATLSEEERELLLKGLEAQGMLSPAERSRKSAALIAASHRRSGGSLTAD